MILDKVTIFTHLNGLIKELMSPLETVVKK